MKVLPIFTTKTLGQRSLGIFLLIIMFAALNIQAQVKNFVRPFGQENSSQSVESSSGVIGGQILYHGGPVMLGPHNVYFIW